jgi:hypothetical protein
MTLPTVNDSLVLTLRLIHYLISKPPPVVLHYQVIEGHEQVPANNTAKYAVFHYLLQ